MLFFYRYCDFTRNDFDVEFIPPVLHVVIPPNGSIIVEFILYPQILLLRNGLGDFVIVHCLDEVVSEHPDCPLLGLLYHFLVGLVGFFNELVDVVVYHFHLIVEFR